MITIPFKKVKRISHMSGKPCLTIERSYLENSSYVGLPINIGTKKYSTDITIAVVIKTLATAKGLSLIIKNPLLKVGSAFKFH